MIRRHGVGAIACAIAMVLAADATGEPTTSGAIRGIVREAGTQPLVGATVVATSPALQGTEVAVSADNGTYHLGNLPPGVYTLTVYWADGEWARSNVVVRLGKTSAVNLDFAPATRTGGEVIEVKGRAPTIDLGSAKTGITITPDYVANVPTGRTFTETSEAASGAQRDTYGVSFYGSTSPENGYVVEGFNVTGVAFGEAQLALPHEFLTETEVITGAYGAEYGRATGGILNVVTKSGGNEFHGSVYGYLTPGDLGADRRVLTDEGSALTFERANGYVGDAGAELGGPIIKDKLWFHAGFNPAFSRQDVDRVIRTQVDRDGDGVPDVGDDGLVVTEELPGRRTIDLPGSTYHFTTKLSYSPSADHRGSISVFGNPQKRRQLIDQFAVGDDATMLSEKKSGAVDAVARWTSDFMDKAGQLEVGVGVHRDQDRMTPTLDEGGDQSFRFAHPRSLGEFTGVDDVPDACVDSGPDDPFPGIVNCPVINYQLGGIDFRSSEERQRIAARIAYRHVVDLGGRHELKAGADVEDNRLESVKQFSGGTRWWDFGGVIARFQFISPDAGGDVPCGIDIDGNGMPDNDCSTQRFLTSNTQTLNTGAFIQDSWSPLPNLTVNAGLRWERQALGAADEVKGQVDPFTGAAIEDRPLVLSDLFAPRVGVVYDWTREGRSRVFGNWGRYYESIPLDINARGMGGEVFDIQVFNGAMCGDPFAPASYDCSAEGYLFGLQQGGNKLVSPNIEGQHSDEWVAGAEYELFEDVTIGATFVRRVLKNVIEDVSPFGGAMVLANPGSVDEGAVADLRARADAANDPMEAARLGAQADLLEGVGNYPKAVRHYNAIEVSAAKRFSDNLMVRGTYTFSRLRGNYPGLFSPDTGQLDPNFTQMYDFAETMPNRFGPLPHDRPHQFKVDGYYTYAPSPEIGTFVFGGRVRGASGRPTNHLGTHAATGGPEIFILPRGSGERAPFQSATDIRVAYGRDLGKGMGLQVFVDVFNLFNQQPTTRRDEIYTYDPVTPIEDGDEDDLATLQTPVFDDTGAQVGTRDVTVNPNYGNAIESQDPLAIRFGARLSF